MAIHYQCEHEEGLIRTRCEGNVTFQEVLAHFRDLEADESVPCRLDVLLDLTQMDSLPASGQLRAVADEMGDLQSKIEWGTCAIVAQNDALYGMSRMFHVFVEAHFSESSVFRDLEEAERWLDRRRKPTA